VGYANPYDRLRLSDYLCGESDTRECVVLCWITSVFHGIARQKPDKIN
jgi:hypothetical protein